MEAGNRSSNPSKALSFQIILADSRTVTGLGMHQRLTLSGQYAVVAYKVGMNVITYAMSHYIHLVMNGSGSGSDPVVNIGTIPISGQTI